jgi:hypothetical protein
MPGKPSPRTAPPRSDQQFDLLKETGRGREGKWLSTHAQLGTATDTHCLSFQQWPDRFEVLPIVSPSPKPFAPDTMSEPSASFPCISFIPKIL